MAIVGSAEVLIRPSFSGLQKGARQAGVEAGRRSGNSFTSQMGQAVTRWAKRGLIAGGVAAGATFVAGVKSGLEQQASTLVLTGLYDNAELAKSTMKSLNEVVKDSPLAGKAFYSGAESLAYAGLQGEAAVKVLENVGNVIVGAGGTEEAMSSFTEAMLSGVNRGKFSMQELNRISNAGVPIYDALSEHIGVTSGEIQDMASKGEIGMEDVVTVLEKADSHFFKIGLAAGDLAKQSLPNQWKIFWGRMTTELGQRLQPALEWAQEWFAGFVSNVGPKFTGFLDRAEALLGAFIQQWRDGEGVGGIFRSVIEGIGEALGSAFDYVRDTVIPALQSTWEWMKANEAWLVPVAAGVGAIVAAWQAYQIGLGVARGVTIAFTAVQAALNAVLNANPIGIVILAIAGLVAAFVTAYKRSEKFRAIVDAAWNGIKTAAETVWNFLSKWVFKPLGKAFKTVWEAGKKAADYIGDAWDWLKDSLNRAWTWIDDKVIQPFNKGWELVKLGFKVQVDAMKDMWEKIKAPFKAVWDWIDDNVIERFKKGLDSLKEHVETIKDGIGKAWRGIANFFRDPINWVLDKVWNNGIAKAFNSAAKVLNLKTRISTEAAIPAFAKGGLAKRGWALVGEEGPELVNFSNPGRVYTASETAEALSLTRAPNAAAHTDSLPMGGGLASRAWDGIKSAGSAVAGWARGGLAAAANLILSPIRKLIAPTVKQWGTVGKFAGGAITSSLDSLVEWIRGKDKEDQDAGLFPDMTGGKWRRPSRGRITSHYGPRSLLGMSFHAGTDFAGGGPTFAAGAGRVFKTGWNILTGRSGIGIGINHGGGVFTYYGHNPNMGAVKVRPGEEVRAGQHIGREGATGNVTGPHLHFEAHRGGWGRHVNPSSFGIFDQGGLLKPGMLAYHSSRMSKPDAVLTSRQWDDIHALATQGGGGDTYNVSLEVDLDDVGDVARLVHTFRELPRRARQKAGVR